MRIIDRYLVRQFLRAFVVTMVSLLGLYVIADFMGNLSEFIDHGQNQGDLWGSVGTYYLARVPWFFELTGRVAALLAAVFSVGGLHRHNELTAIMAAGISKWRVTKPLVVTGILISLLGVANREFAIPQMRESLCRNVQDLAKPKSHELTPQYDNETDVLFEGEGLKYQDKTIESPRFRLATTWSPLGRNLTAESATYQEATPDHPAGYLLTNVDHQELVDDAGDYEVRGRAVVLTPRSHPWLAAGQCFLVSNLTVEQLRKGRQWQQYSSTRQLWQELQARSVDYGADTRVLL
ncbi:MAG: LptF/LptG family permease, partial [Planctomycetales bacterium]|nr:LptF/LptG family permease [Planctomycetales bacterium]